PTFGAGLRDESLSVQPKPGLAVRRRWSSASRGSRGSAFAQPRVDPHRPAFSNGPFPINTGIHLAEGWFRPAQYTRVDLGFQSMVPFFDGGAAPPTAKARGLPPRRCV